MIPQYIPYITNNYADDVSKQIKTTWIGCGKAVKEFESMFSDYVGSKYALSCTSGTIALLIAINALKIKADDEVIVSDYSFIAAVNVLRFLNIKPVLVDIKQDTMCIDPELIRDKITTKTKAVIFINHNGYVGRDIYRVKDICEQNNLFLIEDAACALGQWYYKDVHAGTIGDIGTFSFSVPKPLTTGQGGMIVTKNTMLKNRCMEIIDQGSTTWRQDGWHINTGVNFKFNDILASYGISQLKVIDDIFKLRYNNYKCYVDNGVDLNNFYTHCNNGPWMNIIVSDMAKEIYIALNQHNIESKFLYKPAHYSLDIHGDFPNTEYIYDHALYLPSSLNLRRNQIDFICNIIKGIIWEKT